MNEKIRADFPILSRLVHNKPLVYLDNGATTQKPACVVQSIVDSYYKTNANVHRGVHYLSQQSTELHEHSRKVVQKFINAEFSKEVLFTRGTTESINLVASTFARRFMKPGDEVIVSEMEHHSNIVPWQLLESQGIKVQVVPINDAGELIMEKYQSLFSPKTKLVSLAHVSNVLGTINPVQEIIRIAHEQNVPVMLDGAQAVPHMKVDVQELDVDFYVFSGHKVYGPTGVGVLYGKEKWLNELPPYQGGGEMIQQVSFKGTTFNELPYKFEAGTPDYVGTTALAVALEYLLGIGMDEVARHEDELTKYATERLQEIPNLHIYGTAKAKSSVLSFLVNGIHHFDMGTILDHLGIAVRTGHHCAQPLMHRLGIEGTVRASIGIYNTKEDIDKLIDGIHRVITMFS